MKKTYYILKLGLTQITAHILLSKGRGMVTKMTGNPNFATPVPALATVTTACDDLEKALEAHVLNPGPREKSVRDASFDALRALLIDLGGYVQAASGGDRLIIESAGCDVRRAATPVGLLPAPANVEARTTLYTDRLEVRWSGVRNRLLYNLFICSGDPQLEANWTLLVQTSRNRYTAEGLESGKVYYFRLSTVGVAGESPMSSTTSAKVA
jgi:hypothetical protein